MINKFFSISREILLNKFELSSLADHSTVLGNAREIFIREFLEKILPTDIEYRTGQITNLERSLSNQCDIILQKKSSPRLGLADSNQISFYEFALSILEVKSYLDEEAIENARKHIENILKLGIENELSAHNDNVIKLMRKIKIGVSSYIVYGIPYFIIAYRGMQISTLEEKLKKYNLETSDLITKEILKKISTEEIPISNIKIKIPIIINLEEKYIFIDEYYFSAININSNVIPNKKQSTIDGYVIIEDDDVLKFLFFMLNHIFLTPDYDRDMQLNEYIGSTIFYNMKDLKNDKTQPKKKAQSKNKKTQKNKGTK